MKTFESQIKALSMKLNYREIQNDRKNAMTIDPSELIINPDLFTKVQKNALRFFLRERYGLS